MQTATQPLGAPGAGLATQPVQAPGSFPEVQPTGDVDLSAASDSEADQCSEIGSLDGDIRRDRSADKDASKDDPETEPTEEANYRETMRGVRSFMNWHRVPEFETVSSTADDNSFAGTRVQPTGKVSVKLPVDDWLCRKMSSLNLTIKEGYPTRNTDNTGLLRDQFIKTPRPSRWYGMHAEKDSDSSAVRTWSPDPAKFNHSFSRVARRNLPSAPPSRAFSQDLLRRWERAAREQTIMCNQAAGLSRCLTRVQDSMNSQLKTLRLDSKGKSSEKAKQAVSELEYLTTFNWSVSQAMARTMQDLSEAVFINMANFTLARRDSYLDYLHAGVKQDTVHALRTSPVHLNALFPDQLIAKAEEEVGKSEERRSSGTSHRQQGRFHPYASDKSTSHHTDKKNVPAWKQIKDKQQAKPPHSPRSRLRGPSLINDSYCVNSVTGQLRSVCVTGQGDLDSVPVAAKNSKVTLNVDSHVANAHIVTGLPQRKGVNPTFCQMYTEIKYVKNVSCVGHLCSVNLVTNAQHAVIDPPVGARLNQCWEKWEVLGSSPKVVTTLREGYTLPFRFRPHLTRSPTVISNYHNPTKQSFLVETLYQLINKNAVEPVQNQNSLGFTTGYFWYPNPTTSGDPSWI